MEDIVGLKELNQKLAKLGPEIEKKALKSGIAKASTLAVRNIRSAAPVGKVYHKTYRDRIVSPGFLKRSIAKRTRFRQGVATAFIGVKAEAFYGVTFLEKGKPSQIAKYKGWFTKAFERSEDQMLGKFSEEVNKTIDKVRK